MDRLGKFHLLLQVLKKERPQDKDLFKYIGTGNPNGDILIIGKEASVINKDSSQREYELENNFNNWNKMKDFNANNVSQFESYKNYSPLYPYKGQIFKINNNKNRGTSRTWYNYQKLYNKICNNNNNQTIDFHENVFLTEVNSTPSPKTKDADISSILFRKEYLLKSEFVRSFPIVIISGVGYFNINDTKNEIENIFEVRFETKCNAGKKDKQPYWVHWNANKSKLVINTYQLSIGVADVLINEIADLVKDSNLIDV